MAYVIGHSFALLAGICGACAATCAKIAMMADSAKDVCSFLMSKIWIWQVESASEGFNEASDEYMQRFEPACDSILIYIRLIIFGLVFFFNALMWTLFVKSLQKCRSSLEATVINTAANIFCSALMGLLLFGEALPLLWWIGTTFIVTGLALIHNSIPDSMPETKKEKIS